ncbi:MAG TPA: hypothetical protein VM144_06015, partial [Aestuariivirga sp.]|nr:hypothetical protein [Aestuariivirga sp.]
PSDFVRLVFLSKRRDHDQHPILALEVSTFPIPNSCDPYLVLSVTRIKSCGKQHFINFWWTKGAQEIDILNNFI